VIGAVSVVGAVLGIFFCNSMDTNESFRRSALVGVRGALMMGVCVGYVFAGARASGLETVLGAGVATAMVTYCLFTPAAIRAFRARRTRTVVLNALALGPIGIGAGTVGAAIGVVVA
jgi:hypothetical protein